MTIDDIDASSDDELLALLTTELQAKISAKLGSPEFVRQIKELPVGLRAMAATHQLDVSLAFDDLGWHFGNWPSHELAEETAQGLDELRATELAKLFRDAYQIARNYWTSLEAENWTQWYHGSEFEQLTEPLNREALRIINTRKRGIFDYWINYARHYPEQIGAIETC
jgi:hypothetical protein